MGLIDCSVVTDILEVVASLSWDIVGGGCDYSRGVIECTFAPCVRVLDGLRVCFFGVERRKTRIEVIVKVMS